MNLRSDLWAAGLPVGPAGLPWLAAGGVPSLGLARGGDEVGWEDGLRGVGDGVSAVQRGPGCGGNPVRQMLLTQSEAGCGSKCMMILTTKAKVQQKKTLAAFTTLKMMKK